MNTKTFNVDTPRSTTVLDPLETCQKVDEAWRNGKVPLNAAEGFIRQIIGWREYVRGFYWHQMPHLQKANALNAKMEGEASKILDQVERYWMRKVARQSF